MSYLNSWPRSGGQLNDKIKLLYVAEEVIVFDKLTKKEAKHLMIQYVGDEMSRIIESETGGEGINEFSNQNMYRLTELIGSSYIDDLNFIAQCFCLDENNKDNKIRSCINNILHTICKVNRAKHFMEKYWFGYNICHICKYMNPKYNNATAICDYCNGGCNFAMNKELVSKIKTCKNIKNTIVEK